MSAIQTNILTPYASGTVYNATMAIMLLTFLGNLLLLKMGKYPLASKSRKLP